MSLARRQYNERKRQAPQEVEGEIVQLETNWDEEAIDTAIAQAQQIQEWDPEGAALLYAQASAAKRQLTGSTNLVKPYDPMDTRARILKYYEGGITDEQLEKMDYRRFFGYVRQADIMIEEEREELNKHKTKTGATNLDAFSRPHEYTGETIRLI